MRHKADGTVKGKKVKAGTARIKNPVKAHVFEKVGSKECQILLVEKRK